jgi:phage shock protein PspC (stress-responsive transcriptional regulator)
VKSTTPMKTVSPVSAKKTGRRLQRNLRRRKLGGVCAGLADYTGWNVTVIRFLFLLSIALGKVAVGPLSIALGSIGFWVYVILWLVLPASTEIPIPSNLSWNLQRELRRMDAKVRKMHRKHEPALADLAQEAFDAIKTLAPYFEQLGDARPNEHVVETAVSGFPKLLDKLLATPAAAFGNADPATPSTAGILLNQLSDMRAELQGAANERIEREFRASFRERTVDSPELAVWKEQLRPLQDRLRQRAGEKTAEALEAIEEKLAFLLTRLGENNEILDLRPFEVRKIAFEYLPDTLNQYLALPPAMAQTERLNSGKTAEESLNDQLQLLDTTLHDLAKSLFEKDATGLLVHGRFLKEKFAEQPFRLEH